MSGIDSPMKFEQLRDALETLLASYQANRFRVITEQLQQVDAEESKGTLRTVEIFLLGSDYPDGRSSGQAVAHDLTFQMYYTASEPVTADIATISSDASSEAQVASALLAASSGARAANRSIDVLHRMISQIILDPVNDQLGLAKVGNKNQVSNVRLSGFRKGSPDKQGSLVTLTAAEQLTVRVEETFTGATPTAAEEPAIDIEVEFKTTTDATDADPSKFGIDVTTA